MEETDFRQQREEIYSVVVRAGKRTYFFDVKETRAKEKYLTITESKRRFNNDTAKFVYEKHKIFLYQEDFEKFTDGLTEVIDFIKTGKISEPRERTEFESEESASDIHVESKLYGENEPDADSDENDTSAMDQDEDFKY